MNGGPTQRLSFLQRAMAALTYAAAVVLLVVLAWSGIADMLARRQSVAAASDLLAQLEGRRPGAFATPPGSAGTAPTGSPFLEGQTLTVAGAALLQRVADAVTKVGGNVLSSQVDVQGVQAKDGYVSVIASCEVDQAAMQPLLYDIEAGMPFLFVEQFVAQAALTGTQAPAAGGRMRLLLAVSGRWQGDK